MTELGPVAWSPHPIGTERLVLHEPEARDRAAVIELLASPEVGTYLGARLAAKLGFIEVERFGAYGTRQWFGERSSVATSHPITDQPARLTWLSGSGSAGAGG